MDLEYAAIAKMLDHALLAPTLTAADIDRGLELARAYDVASVCIVPSFVPRAAELLHGSDVRVSTTIGFPHGAHATSTKLHEAERALAEGATELDAVVNVNRVLSDDYAAVRNELVQLTKLTHAARATIKIIFENCYLTDRHKVRLCEIASEARVDWVKTSTGFGSSGATLADVQLMRRHSAATVQVKASGGLRDLESILVVRPYVTRCGTSRTREILDELRTRLGLPPLALVH